ncbi:MAG: ATPase, T2SS/T4P/T4SS family, partial [Planctomycetota bacterium]
MNQIELHRLIAASDPRDADFAVQLVDALLQISIEAGASDLHLTPSADELRLQWRIDGVLQPLGAIPKRLAGNVVTRLKVLARLLTYQTSVPQEGRLTPTDADVEVRVSTFPTLFGEKIVARNLPRGDVELALLADLQLPPPVENALREALRQTSGALLLVGPAGSGKSTTGYACLRELVQRSECLRSVASLEDPVEVVVDGVAQSEASAANGFDLHTGLRSLVRQDPEVIYIGEMRDPETAKVALQAAMTGQLMITTFHAGDAAEALCRLTDMGVPSYVLRSAVRTVTAQRLLRRLCSCSAAADAEDRAATLGLQVSALRRPVGCDACRNTGYLGRIPLAEALRVDHP